MSSCVTIFNERWVILKEPATGSGVITVAISELRLLLYQLDAQLTKQPVAISGTGVPIEDAAHDREDTELGLLSLRFRLILRELRSKSNLLSVRERNVWNLPQLDRYRATASIRGQQAEIAEVLKLAKKVRARLEELIAKSRSVGEFELAQGIAEFIEKTYQQVHLAGEVQIRADSPYFAASKGDLGGSVEGVTIAAFVALRVLIHLMKRDKRN